jgi:hypothetical protein
MISSPPLQLGVGVRFFACEDGSDNEHSFRLVDERQDDGVGIKFI